VHERLVGSLRDVTEEQLLSAALAHSPESVSIYDLDSTVHYMNPATERIMGVRFEDVRGKRLFEIYPDAIGSAFHAAFECVSAGGEPQAFEHYYPRFDGWYSNRVLRIGDYIHVYARDVTDDVRRRHEAHTAIREAEDANRAKDQFLAMLGHELRNPLAPLVTALELMRMRSPEQLQRERAVIERQVDHLSRLVDDLLDVSRITRGKVELRRERVPLASVTSKAIEQTSPLFEHSRHTLRVDVPSDLYVHGDPTRLAQIVANLLSNAAKYTPRGGTVEISARRTDDEIELAVRDNGIGIDGDMLPQVFDLFVQAPQPSARTRGGLGLGLTIVRSLVEMHGGTVIAESEGEGKGSVFSIRLPEASEPRAVDEAERAPQLPRASVARRILVVDDNEDAANLLAEVLVAHGHHIRTAADGPSALRVADEFQPDVAVLDIGLPVMDGYELAERIRATPTLANMRLIAVTGYGQESDRARALDAGFHEHLAKPVAIDTLVRLVDNSG
jgi:PAS domain S-box-containing protein